MHDILDKLASIQANARITKEDTVLNGRDRQRKRVQYTGSKICPILIAADHLFLENIGRGDVATSMAEIVTIVTKYKTFSELQTLIMMVEQTVLCH